LKTILSEAGETVEEAEDGEPDGPKGEDARAHVGLEDDEDEDDLEDDVLRNTSS
jgi:hypothetical protein